MQRSQTVPLVRHFSENAEQQSHIKMTIRIRQIFSRIAGRVANIAKTTPGEFSFGLGKHLRLQVEQFQPAVRNSCSQRGAEITRTGTNFQDSARIREPQSVGEIVWRDDETSQRVVDDPGQLVWEQAKPVARGASNLPLSAGCVAAYRPRLPGRPINVIQRRKVNPNR